ncbi:alpha,alpha-trehalase TreA [Christiangramia aquimixticola]|uniref:alpha,alpha-trehalase TreA n=1 Tax=Christiangramia aquimixticola TaxID=1697558 RepID=UPI003AA984E3
MKNFSVLRLNLYLVLLILASCKIGPDPEQDVQQLEKEVKILPPDELYGDLFYDVQTKSIFEDSKTFVDVQPEYNVGLIRQRYSMLNDTTAEGIRNFVNQHFSIPGEKEEYKTDSSSINSHIKKLWQVLKRPADDRVSGTLIPLPEPYIVPGGRFREIYYWDSYFTMLGLQADGEIETIRNMVDNFAYLINSYGFIPNGNRTYYLGRSQPPFLAMMVQVLAEEEGEAVLAEYLPELELEYEFWMKGKEKLSKAGAVNRVVRLENGTVLNRYWDELNTPRPESYREDVETAKEAMQVNPTLSKEDIYRNLRAGAESGWDYSSRWLVKDENGEFKLSTIQTTSIIPVDLNSLLYNLEKTIAEAASVSGDTDKAEKYNRKAADRKQAIQQFLWDAETQFFQDYNFKENRFTNNISLAGVYPLFFSLANNNQATEVASRIEKDFLKPGGVVTTPYNTGQQWDAPNGWAPLQWIAITGLRNYEQQELSNTIKKRWLAINEEVYKRTYKMTEKYNVMDLSKESGGGEYPTQDGFGWTNGVYQKLSSEK